MSSPAQKKPSRPTPTRPYAPKKGYHLLKCLPAADRPATLPPGYQQCMVVPTDYEATDFLVPSHQTIAKTNVERRIRQYGFDDNYRILHGDQSKACDGPGHQGPFIVCDLCACAAVHYVQENHPDLCGDTFLPLCQVCSTVERMLGNDGQACTCARLPYSRAGNWLCVPCRIAALQARPAALAAEEDRHQAMGPYLGAWNGQPVLARICKCGQQMDGGTLAECACCGGFENRIGVER
ncbi:MAG: hypothetical protein MMC23_001612 [Stictis urceolatum]|nr:hypothetical protein [Stictis urceolata]